jgi:hypothetical protein
MHDSWALLQQMASEFFTIIIVNINMGLFSMVTELWVHFNRRKRPPANLAAQITLRDLEPAGTGSQQELQLATRNSQLALSTTERQRELQPAVAFPKTCLEQRSV